MSFSLTKSREFYMTNQILDIWCQGTTIQFRFSAVGRCNNFASKNISVVYADATASSKSFIASKQVPVRKLNISCWAVWLQPSFTDSDNMCASKSIPKRSFRKNPFHKNLFPKTVSLKALNSFPKSRTGGFVFPRTNRVLKYICKCTFG